MKKHILALVAGVAVLTAMTSTVGAQPKPGGDGLSVSPLRTELTINPGESKSTTVNVTNVTDNPTDLKVIINDFGASQDETGTPQVYLDENSSAPSRGLKSYVQPQGNITLQPKERKSVKITINMPKNVAGGGYYGLVRFAPASAGTKGSQVSLSGSVGSLLLVTVPGNIVEQASVKSFNTARMNGDNLGKASNFFVNGGKDAKGNGIQAVLRVQNSGNIQIAPFGKAILSKGGKELATFELNKETPKQNVLPDSTRRFQINMGDKTSSLGRYTVQGNFGYGTKGQLISASTSFWVVPKPYVVAFLLLIVLIIVAAVMAPRMLKRHDRKLLRKVRGRGKR